MLPVSATFCHSSTAIYPDAERVICMRSGNSKLVYRPIVDIRSSGLVVFQRTISGQYTRKNAQVVAILMTTGLNNVLLPTLFTVVNNIEQYCYTRTILFNIVDKCEQRGQQNIVQSY